MKQTAVEWLFEKLWNTGKDKFTWYAILKQAKEMEKEQIVKAYESLEHRHGENYYNETFNKSINNKG
jgi:hypothetical protein